MDAELLSRIDRIESMLAIQQLPIRYALAVDGRDIDAWIGLFVEDVDCGPAGKGREALRTTIEQPLTTFYRSIHLICGHQLEFTDADHATRRSVVFYPPARTALVFQGCRKPASTAVPGLGGTYRPAEAAGGFPKLE
jgi:hypothetical protein